MRSLPDTMLKRFRLSSQILILTEEFSVVRNIWNPSELEILDSLKEDKSKEETKNEEEKIDPNQNSNEQ